MCIISGLLSVFGILVFLIAFGALIWCSPLVQMHSREHAIKRKYPYYHQMCGCSDEWILGKDK